MESISPIDLGTPILNLPLSGWQALWGHGQRIWCPSFSGVHPTAQEGLGLREVPDGANGPISRAPICCFPPVHSPSSELSSCATETSGGKVRTRVGGPQLLSEWIPHSFFPKPSNCHPFHANPHPRKYLEGNECSEVTSRKRGFNCHLSLGA